MVESLFYKACTPKNNGSDFSCHFLFTASESTVPAGAKATKLRHLQGEALGMMGMNSIYMYKTDMGVSENRGTPKWMV